MKLLGDTTISSGFVWIFQSVYLHSSFKCVLCRMVKLITFVGILLTPISTILAFNTTDGTQNKTKRGVIDQTYYGEPHYVKTFHTPTYPDSVSAAAANSGSNNYYNTHQRTTPIFNGLPVQVKPAVDEPPKQVTVQQVVYEYQQTPHNAVSNVHVNQQFQTSPEQRQFVLQDGEHPHETHPSNINPQFVNQPHILHVEPNQFSGVATPVQHGTVIHHGQGYSKLLYGPFNPVVPTTSSPLAHQPTNAQTKYLYANGKILYHPLPIHLHNTNTPYPGIVLPARPHNLVTHSGLLQRPPIVQHKPFKPSPLIPITFSKAQPHPILIPTSTKKPEAPVKEEVEEEKENDDKSEVQEEEEGDEDHSSYEEEEEEDEPSYGKYRYESDEDDDHESYVREHEDDEDDDNTRSYSRYIRKKPKKYVRSESKPSAKYQKNDHYKFKEGYKTNKKYSSEYKSPNYKHDKKPKGEYKTYKYYKSASSLKPKKEHSLQSLQSQNVPVVHKHKVYQQEKWMVTKKEDTE